MTNDRPKNLLLSKISTRGSDIDIVVITKEHSHG